MTQDEKMKKRKKRLKKKIESPVNIGGRIYVFVEKKSVEGVFHQVVLTKEEQKFVLAAIASQHGVAVKCYPNNYYLEEKL